MGAINVRCGSGNTLASHICCVEISNPSKRNAMSRKMWRALRQAFLDLQSNPQVRCVIVQGVGDSFCAGGDISEYPSFRFDAASLEAFHEQEVWGALSAMLACDVPLIASIQGACMGAGVEIASCCDIRLSADTGSFGAPIAKLGFPMAPKEMQLVANAVGQHVAQRMLLEAAVFNAHEMAQQGFVSDPVSAEDLWDCAWSTARRIAQLSPQAARLNKQTLRSLRQGTPMVQPYAYADSEEHREGVGAFIAKRAPRFVL